MEAELERLQLAPQQADGAEREERAAAVAAKVMQLQAVKDKLASGGLWIVVVLRAMSNGSLWVWAWDTNAALHSRGGRCTH